jgi:ubiquinone/menaquinone biosynthesis C-methylase UbiE
MNLELSCCGYFSNSQKVLDARIPQNQIGHVYDRIAGLYDVWGYLTESRARNRAIELAQITNGQTILEVAVGTGLAFYEIVKRNPAGNNTGIDISHGMLQKAKKRLAKLSWAHYSLLQGTAFHLPVADGSVDILVNNYMFDLMPYEEMDTLILEFKRTLKNDGRLVLVNMTKGKSFGSRMYDFIYSISPKTLAGCRGVQISDKLKEHGFLIETREYYQQMLFPSEVILARK